MKQKCHNIFLYVWYRYIGGIFRLLPIRKRRVVCSSFSGQGFGDNPKYIVEEIRKMDISCEIIWLQKPHVPLERLEGIHVVRRGTFAELYYLSTAKVWIDNKRKHFGVKKRKGQYYIQTWHGCISLKRIEGDVKNKLPDYYIKSAKHDSSMIDVMLSNGKWCTQMYRRAFWYNNKIIECGSPRVDILFHTSESLKKKMYNFFGIKPDTHILLYAPTFRDTGSMEQYALPYEKLRIVLRQKFGGDWVILNRLHPKMSYQNFNVSLDYVYEATQYSDMYELLAICDILITDYSSTMMEMGYIKRPVFLYTTDRADYADERGYYFLFKELPYPAAENDDELLKIISAFNINTYIQKLEKFHKKLGLIETGHASEYIGRHIVEEILQDV